MGAVTQIQYANGAGPTLANAETGIKFNRADTQTGTTPTPVPTTTGNKHSYFKCLALVVTGTASTTISNRRVSLSTNPTAGLKVFFLDQPTYTQNNGVQGTSAGNYPADNASANGTAPTGYTEATTTPQLWDNTSVSTGSAARNGDYLQLVFQASNAYDSSGNLTLSATALPDIKCYYDES